MAILTVLTLGKVRSTGKKTGRNTRCSATKASIVLMATKS